MDDLLVARIIKSSYFSIIFNAALTEYLPESLDHIHQKILLHFIFLLHEKLNVIKTLRET